MDEFHDILTIDQVIERLKSEGYAEIKANIRSDPPEDIFNYFRQFGLTYYSYLNAMDYPAPMICPRGDANEFFMKATDPVQFGEIILKMQELKHPLPYYIMVHKSGMGKFISMIEQGDQQGLYKYEK